MLLISFDKHVYHPVNWLTLLHPPLLHWPFYQVLYTLIPLSIDRLLVLYSILLLPDVISVMLLIRCVSSCMLPLRTIGRLLNIFYGIFRLWHLMVYMLLEGLPYPSMALLMYIGLVVLTIRNILVVIWYISRILLSLGNLESNVLLLDPPHKPNTRL
jgi:hypothetical protein